MLAEYAAELGQLQSQAPPMGWPFVRRRMAAELGPDWESRFASFKHDAAASASLGQVHKARAQDGRSLAAKLQYPDMQSAAEAELKQLSVLFSIHRRLNAAVGHERRDRSALARRARLRSRSAPHAPLRTDLRRRSSHSRSGGLAGAVNAPLAHHDLARWTQDARLHGPTARRAQHHRLRHVPR